VCNVDEGMWHAMALLCLPVHIYISNKQILYRCDDVQLWSPSSYTYGMLSHDKLPH
jgi:hypothetical protein